MGFRFKSTKPAPAVSGSSKGLSFTVSIPAVATGSIAGSFTDRVETPCPGFEPREPFSEDAMTPKQLRRKKLTITGRASVDCTIPSQYTGGVKLIASLRYTLSLKRIG